jgi:hypothetical protein
VGSSPQALCHPDGGYALMSEIPNHRITKYSEKDGKITILADSFDA